MKIRKRVREKARGSRKVRNEAVAEEGKRQKGQRCRGDENGGTGGREREVSGWREETTESSEYTTERGERKSSEQRLWGGERERERERWRNENEGTSIRGKEH